MYSGWKYPSYFRIGRNIVVSLWFTGYFTSPPETNFVRFKQVLVRFILGSRVCDKSGKRLIPTTEKSNLIINTLPATKCETDWIICTLETTEATSYNCGGFWEQVKMKLGFSLG